MADALQLPVNLHTLEDLKKFEGCTITKVVVAQGGVAPELSLDLSHPLWDMQMRLTIYPQVSVQMVGTLANFRPSLMFKHNAVVARPKADG